MTPEHQKEFKEWADSIGFKSDWDRGITFHAWKEQQKKIDDLKSEISNYVNLMTELEKDLKTIHLEAQKMAMELRKVRGQKLELKKEINELKAELAQTKEVEIKACNLAAELEVKNTELEKDSDELHEQIMRLRILLEEAEGVIRLYAPGFSVLLENIEVALYGEKLTNKGGEE